jgi:uncharacterized protein (TIGR03790 family)
MRRDARGALRVPPRTGAESIRRRRRAQRALGAVLLLACGGAEEPPPGPHPEVLVLVNAASPVSLAIGSYYAQRRQVPAENLLALELPLADPSLVTPGGESIPRERYEREVEAKLRAWLAQPGRGEAIRVVVTALGLPLRVTDPHYTDDYEQQRGAAFDAELALFGSDRVGRAGLAANPNPFLASDERLADWRARQPGAPLRFAVGRLAGFPTPLDAETGVPVEVKSLIDAAQADGPEGVYVVDEDPRQVHLGRGAGNPVLLTPAAAALEALGARVLHDTARERVAGVESIAGYASWGSNDAAAGLAPFYGEIGGRWLPGRFAARAISVDLVSTNGRSFAFPPDYGQSLVADLVRMGVAGAAAHSDEPTLAAVARPALLLSAYLQGWPAGEAFLRSVPYLGWANYYVGDPLMQVARPRRAPADRDGDGVPDARDVCRDLPDPDQRDSDADGYGNACDPDVDGDGVVTTRGGGRAGLSDLGRIRRSHQTGLYVPDCDLDGDGEVDERDLEHASFFVGLPPGPSGVAGATVR